MAPQATQGVPAPTVPSSAPPTPAPAPANVAHKPFIPVLMIFLGLCLAYTLSYVLYRIIMSRRRQSEEDMPDSPDRGVSQFMNGARLTLNFGHNPKSTPSSSESPDILDEEKPLTDPSHSTHGEIPMSSPAASSSTPFIIMMPSFTMHPNRELGGAQPQEQDPTEAQAPLPSPGPSQKPLSQRVTAKVKLLSTDRAEAIALDPKLAPVQGPLRPLSMIPRQSRKKRMTLFGLGLKHVHGRGGDPEAGSEAR